MEDFESNERSSLLSLDIGSACAIYSRSSNKWFDGIITNIFIDNQTEKDQKEWLVVKYGKKSKEIQRFCPDLRLKIPKYDDKETQTVAAQEQKAECTCEVKVAKLTRLNKELNAQLDENHMKKEQMIAAQNDQKREYESKVAELTQLNNELTVQIHVKQMIAENETGSRSQSDDDGDEQVMCLNDALKEKLDHLIDEEFLYGLSSQLRKTCKTYASCDPSMDAEQSKTGVAQAIFNENIGEDADKTNIKRNILNKLQMQLEDDATVPTNDVQINEYIDNKFLEIFREVGKSYD
eukprot:54616_1